MFKKFTPLPENSLPPLLSQAGYGLLLINLSRCRLNAQDRVSYCE